MKVLRTPEKCFAQLKDYPFEANYIDVADNLRMHYVDVGSHPEGETILMLHGEPSWSYLYRHMIPICAAAGYRVVAPDLIGFGKSDKPTKIKDYSYQSHMDWTTTLVEKLDLRNITLVCQDWGSIIGLRVAAEKEHRFARIVVGNGFLPTGEFKYLKKFGVATSVAFMIWKTFAVLTPRFPVGGILQYATRRTLDEDEVAAYNAPFPDNKYKAGTRAFPRLVPITPFDPATEANKAAWKILEKWNKPFLTCFSKSDPVTRNLDNILQNSIPGAKGRQHRRVAGGHFLQEDSPEAFANAALELIRDNPLSNIDKPVAAVESVAPVS